VGDHVQLRPYFWIAGDEGAEGIGMFFQYVGLDGKGVIPGGPRDTYGVGWARTEISDEFLPSIRRRLNLSLEHEDVIARDVCDGPAEGALPGLEEVPESRGRQKSPSVQTAARSSSSEKRSTAPAAGTIRP
jgi:hypothetical protein